MRLKLLAALFAGGVVFSSSVLAHEPSVAAMLSNTCNGCHGTNGNSAGPNTANLGGVSSNYIVEQMKNFKSGERKSSIMGRLAKAYSDEEIALIGSFYSTQKYVGATQPTDAAKVARGKDLHKERCEKCHEEGGKVGQDEGILAGQWKETLGIAFNEFRSKARPMPKKMAAKIEGEAPLNDADIDALVHFYASQK
ncbi:MAG: cytochrome c4 [Sulfuricella sp.]|nr:cytochrome c4 [Sulfuricella sp.]